MHGLINKTIQCFVRDSYGKGCWADVVERAGLEFTEFEAMLVYDEALTYRVLEAISDILKKSCAEVLEDIGTYLVSHPNAEALRRLLRFGGVGFVDFLHSLDDLPERARLAVSDLDLPRLELWEHAPDHYSLTCHGCFEGFGHVLLGLLRAMADDYGALAFLDHLGREGGAETVDIRLIETAFSTGRSFELGARSA